MSRRRLETADQISLAGVDRLTELVRRLDDPRANDGRSDPVDAVTITCEADADRPGVWWVSGTWTVPILFVVRVVDAGAVAADRLQPSDGERFEVTVSHPAPAGRRVQLITSVWLAPEDEQLLPWTAGDWTMKIQPR